MADRRTQVQQHTKLCAKRDALEDKISEQEAFKTITAAGDYGASTDFANIDSLERSLSRVMNAIATVERQLEL